VGLAGDGGRGGQLGPGCVAGLELGYDWLTLAAGRGREEKG
jgi:hypothetical protein